MNRHGRDLDTGRPFDQLADIPADVEHAALLQILAHAHNPADAQQLLNMLGITPHRHPK